LNKYPSFDNAGCQQLHNNYSKRTCDSVTSDSYCVAWVNDGLAWCDEWCQVTVDEFLMAHVVLTLAAKVWLQSMTPPPQADRKSFIFNIQPQIVGLYASIYGPYIILADYTTHAGNTKTKITSTKSEISCVFSTIKILA